MCRFVKQENRKYGRVTRDRWEGTGIGPTGASEKPRLISLTNLGQNQTGPASARRSHSMSSYNVTLKKYAAHDLLYENYKEV